MEDGWGHIKVVTDGHYPDEIQAEAAGYLLWCAVIARYLEGYVEYERIAQHVSNIRAINFGSNPIPAGIENYLKEQIAFIRKMVCTCSSFR